jgi:hypothetical protein
MPYLATLPTWLALNAANFSSPTGLTDLRTGNPQYGGALNLGDYFDLTEAEANQLSNTATGTLHAGRYRFVRVDSAATAANVKTGTVGLMRSMALGVNVVTSFDQGLGGGSVIGVRPVVFLNAFTPTNYGFIQELGDATVLGAGSVTAPVGTAVGAVAGGLVSQTVTTPIGRALEAGSASTLFRVLLDLPVVQG